ncbi:hypothetical protein GE09DRAFT_292663 [Coniochaeta sp. 2T2.1]|nr:hypothetical protein GE09DRAFT_292663 [Coniochaeta sp. 2T2.1]
MSVPLFLNNALVPDKVFSIVEHRVFDHIVVPSIRMFLSTVYSPVRLPSSTLSIFSITFICRHTEHTQHIHTQNRTKPRTTSGKSPNPPTPQLTMPFGLPNPLKGKSKGMYRALPDSASSPSFPKPATAAPKPKPYNRNTLYDPAPNLNPPLAPAPAPACPRNAGRPGSSSSTACLPGTPRHGPLIDLDPYSEHEEDIGRQVGELRAEMRELELEGLEFPVLNRGMAGDDEALFQVDAPPGPVIRDSRGKEKTAEFGSTALDMLRGARSDAAWRVRLHHQEESRQKKEATARLRMEKEVENERKKMGFMAGIGVPPCDQEGGSVLFDSDEFAELEENVFEDEGMEVVEYDDEDEEDEADDKKEEVAKGKTGKGKYNTDLTRGSRGRYPADSASSVSSHSSDDSWCSTSDNAPSDDEEEAPPAEASKEKKKKKTLAAKLLSLARKKKKKAAAQPGPKVMDAALAEMVSEEAGAWAEVSDSSGLEEGMGKMGIAGEGMSIALEGGGGSSGDEVDLVVDENYFA